MQSDYELSDDQQSIGDCEISDSEGNTSHGDQPIRTKACLSVADVLHVLKIATVIE